jgi:2-polyprenyl-3-methyl-5-hydroxy-6-metoxy-1,4-benzoquinol methylase
MGGRFDAVFMECNLCRSLQVTNPTWLDIAYEKEATASGIALDTGRLRRNYSAFVYLTALEAAGFFPRRARFLDFGGGSGLLTQILVDTGHSAWQSDLYNNEPMFAGDRFVHDPWSLEAQSFDVLTALEVVEHLVDPVPLLARLGRLIKTTGVLIISTEIYQSGTHTPDWPYLATQSGQHVTLWSVEALLFLRNEIGFQSLGFFPGKAGFLLIFSHDSEKELLSKLSRAHRKLKDPKHVGRVMAGLDFRSHNIITDSYGILKTN